MKVIETGGRPIFAWIEGVPVEDEAIEQLKRVAELPFVFRHVAAMPDVHAGAGSTIGTVFASTQAIVPAAVGVDIGCGMYAANLGFPVAELRDLPALRAEIERLIPMGRTNNGREGDRGAWGTVPVSVQTVWDTELADEFSVICGVDADIARANTMKHLGTLGTGNHFIEICGDESGTAWILLHSGSRGVGNRIGQHFTKLAQTLCEQWMVPLPHKDLAFLPRHTAEFDRYIRALEWAQRYAALNRQLMIESILAAIRTFRPETQIGQKINCHHNYMAWENHFNTNVMVTRKGAVRARLGDSGVIPGNMGARSYIVKGLGNPLSFTSCSHGAGRRMSRTKAKATFTLEDHAKATAGVECRKDAEVLDETPAAYKDIDMVMAAQADLVEPIAILKQVLCCKG